MYKLPGQSRKYTQLNNSDLFGSFSRTKNIDLDEEGYIKLSPRMISLISTDDDAQFDIPAAFGRQQEGVFNVVGIDEPFIIQIDAGTAITASQDEDSGDDSPPALTEDSHGIYWQNRWYTTEDQLVVYKTLSNGNWTDTAIALTSGKLHPLAVFKNRVTLCIGDGRQVLQYTEAHGASTTLTLPTEFEVTKLAYSNTKMGIATKLSNTVSGQNGEAYFFVWDGANTSAQQGVSAGTDWIIDVVAYKGTFVILTRSGLLRIWNGGGFEDLAELPVYFTPRTWGDSVNAEGYGDLMVVDGDVIYLNINNTTSQYGRKGEEYLAPGGVWCYDPNAGLYHKWSPSISPASRLTVTTSNVNTSTDVLTTTAGTIPTTGSPIKYIDSPTDEIGGLSIGKVYYCIKLTSTTMQLAETYEKAVNGVAIDLIAQASGTSLFLAIELRDYSQSYIQRTGAVALHEASDLVRNQIVLGAELQDYNATTDLEHLCFDCTEFRNIGYFVTSRLVSEQIKDFWQKLFTKHRRLQSEDKIIAKIQTNDVYGLPVSTPQHGQHCTWSGANEFYTSVDLAEAKTWLDAGNELECEIIGGAGAGQMSQISEINFESNVYSVVLEDEMQGVAATNICDVLIENWKVIGTQTATDEEIKEFAGEEASSGWAKFKVILDGVDIKIQESVIVNKNSQPAL